MSENIETISYINPGDGQNHPIDAVTVGGKTIPDETSLLPSVSNSDNGKVLRVIGGQWVLVTLPSSIQVMVNHQTMKETMVTSIYKQ